ncbi:MAG: MazG nucleotide pyrophosphohydrolase domain-containing protein [Bacillota bacterium]
MKVFNFKEYQEKARETAQYPIIGHPSIYPLLGLVGELGEFSMATEKPENEEELKKEAGDILWYIANLAYELEIDLGEIDVPDKFVPVDFYINEGASAICEYTKKVFRDDSGQFDVEKAKELISKFIISYFAILYIWQLDIEEVAELNISKLRDRQQRGVIQGSGDNR